MIPDPTTVELATRTGLPYDDVHDALAVLAACGWIHAHAVAFVEQQAVRVGPVFSSVADIARATGQARLAATDRCVGGHLVVFGATSCHVCGEPTS